MNCYLYIVVLFEEANINEQFSNQDIDHKI